MIPEKWIYSFTLDKEINVDKTEVSKDEAGAEIRITKAVKEKKPFVFKLKKPTRKIIEEADIFYAAKVGEYLKAGLLSKNLIAKRLENDGGDLGEDTKKEFAEVANNYYKTRLEVESLESEVKEKNLDADKEKLSKAKEAFEDFAKTRGEGAAKIASNAEEKGGLALLTWHHFKVKAPYYKKAVEGKLDMEKAEKEFEETYKKISLDMSQIEFQREVGRLEVLGELLIRNK